MEKLDWTVCPRCKRCPREISILDGEMEMYCESCNDKLADNYQQHKEFVYYHGND